VSNLLARHPQHKVSVCDLSPSRIAPLVAQGAVAAEASVAASACDVLITALPAPQHVREVMEKQGILRALRPGTIWIDHTTTDPAEAVRLAVLAKQHKVRPLEAPLTGGLELLKAGKMTTLVGGERALFDSQLELLKAYTTQQLYIGETGKASVVKVKL